MHIKDVIARMKNWHHDLVKLPSIIEENTKVCKENTEAMDAFVTEIEESIRAVGRRHHDGYGGTL